MAGEGSTGAGATALPAGSQVSYQHRRCSCRVLIAGGVNALTDTAVKERPELILQEHSYRQVVLDS